MTLARSYQKPPKKRETAVSTAIIVKGATRHLLIDGVTTDIGTFAKIRRLGVIALLEDQT